MAAETLWSNQNQTNPHQVGLGSRLLLGNHTVDA